MTAVIHTVAGANGGPDVYELDCRPCNLSLPFRTYANAVVVRDEHNAKNHEEES